MKKKYIWQIEYTKSDAMLPQSLQIFGPQHIEKES